MCFSCKMFLAINGGNMEGLLLRLLIYRPTCACVCVHTYIHTIYIIIHNT